MRLRYIAIVFVVGLYFVQMYGAPITAYLTLIFGCLIAYGLRQIEGHLIR